MEGGKRAMQTPVEKKRIKRNWAKEEIDYLTEFWGKVSVPILAKDLGRLGRSALSVKRKFERAVRGTK
jgi:hypothetical protein